jgi:hypothetical protein
MLQTSYLPQAGAVHTEVVIKAWWSFRDHGDAVTKGNWLTEIKWSALNRSNLTCELQESQVTSKSLDDLITGWYAGFILGRVAISIDDDRVVINVGRLLVRINGIIIFYN